MKISDLKKLIERAAVVRVKNAMNPLLWLTAVASPMFLVGSVFAAKSGSDFLSIFFAVMSAIPLTLCSIAYLYFMVRDPDRLHSEEFQIKQRELILFQKHDTNLIMIEDAVSLPNKEVIEKKPKGRIK